MIILAQITMGEFTALIASIASLILAIVAITLSIVFYRFSSDLQQKTIHASDEISSSVNKLEELFGSLYSDTFSIMKDTVSDMRRHVWPEGDTNITEKKIETEKMIQENLDKITNDFSTKTKEILKEQRIQDNKIKELQKELDYNLKEAIKKSRKVESTMEEKSLQNSIIESIKMHTLLRKKENINMKLLMDHLLQYGFPPRQIIDETVKLLKDEFISIDTPSIKPYSNISLTEKGLQMKFL